MSWQFIDPTPTDSATDVWGVNYQPMSNDFPHGIIDIVGDDGHLRSFDGDKTAKARKVGELVAERAKAAGVEEVVFDRGGNRYAGRVAAIADGAREGGLNL